MTINKNVRNVVIVLALAGLKDVLPGGGPASSTLIQAISLGFLGAFVWIASRLYREHRTSLYSLGDRRRAIVYVAAGVVVLTLSATGRLWASPLGSIAWLLLIGASVIAVFQVYRASREY